jgi:hypothetical protein
LSQDCVELALADLPPELATPESSAALIAATATAPSFAAVGFEVRLASGPRQLDVQLGTQRNERDSLARSLARAQERDGLSEPWARMLELCREWTTPGTPLDRALAELWCELDLDPGEEARSLADLAPSVFVLVRKTAGADRYVCIERVLEHLLAPDPRPALRATIAQCRDACPPGAWVSHVGVMLGRASSGARVHVSDVPLATVGRYLADIAWPGDRERAVAAARLLLDHGDRVVLCLDAMEGLLPRIGLECFFDQRHGVDPRWGAVLDRLVDEGLAAPEKTAAILRWPGTLTPADVPWPELLLARSLGQPADMLGVFERRLSHVKLAFGAGEPATAKAYFGAGHVWRRLAAEEGPSRPARAIRPAWSVPDAVDRALGFMLAARNQGGWWRDFYDRARPAHVDRRVAGYASDEWVTAYVAGALASLDREPARSATQEALALLLAREHSGPGWGYHALLPADADTSAWVLRLAAALDAPPDPRLARTRSFIAGLVGLEGGVATYPPAAADPLEAFLELPGPYDGWCSSHVCVTGAAAVLDLGPEPLSFLRHAQRDDGSWTGHWWDDDEYATLRAIEALGGGEANARAVQRAVEWAASRIGGEGSVSSVGCGGPSVFATALSLHAVLAGDGEGRHERTASRAVRWLLSQQHDDGSWAPSARLRVPAPSERDPVASPGTTLTYIDDEALFTTATVLAAFGGLTRE